METLKRLIHEDEGQNLIEYALLAGLVALVAITAITNIGGYIGAIYTQISDSLSVITVP
jgi:pilus assembly protein Flp/PilA